MTPIEKATARLRTTFTLFQADAILDAIEIMGNPEVVVYAGGGGSYIMEEPAPEPEEPLDTRVCRALGKHDRTETFDDNICYGPDDSPWQNRCYPWSTSELGVGAMLAWLHERGVGALALANERANVREGRWRVSYFPSLNGGSRDYIQGDTPAAALAHAVAAVGEKDA